MVAVGARTPAPTNPLLDTTGADCGVGQSGSVFFLAGLGGSGSVTRNCTVPAGKALFFPLSNGFDVHVPGLDNQDTPELIWNDLEVTNAFKVNSVFARVDGVDLTVDPSTYRACAGPVSGCAATYSLTLPDDNLFGIPAGTYAPAVADGADLLMAPLRPGKHTITFGGTGFFGGDFSQDITYDLTVSAT